MQSQSSDYLAELRNREEAYYDELWSSYEWGTKEPNEDERLRYESIVKLIKDYVLPESKESTTLRILDLGCGRGWLTNLLSVYGQIKGADPVSTAIKKAKVLFPAHDFVIGDATDLLAKLGPEYFNLVVSSEVIEHVLDVQKKGFLESIHSLLAPGGFAILTTPRAELWDACKRSNLEEQPVEQWLSEASLDHLSRSVGFTVMARDRVFLPQYIYDWKSSVASSLIFNRLMSYFPQSKILSKLRYYCGIYQVILLKRL